MVDTSPRIEWLERTVSGNRILDIGFVGEYDVSAAHRAVSRANPESTLVGLDIKSSIADRRVDEGIRGDLFRLPFEQESFDSIVFAEVLEHLSQPFDALQELHRVVETGGYLYLTTINPFGLYRYLRHYLLPRSLDASYYLGAEDHEAFLDPMSLTSLLSKVGFETESLTFRNVSLPRTPTLPDWALLRRWPFNRAGSYTCLVARRTG
jgi:ubiquinone/menaquinone biosynthesis C-methylase UbiE